MNHKRHRPKNRRAGCLLCKAWKVNGAKRARNMIRPSELRRMDAANDSIREVREHAAVTKHELYEFLSRAS